MGRSHLLGKANVANPITGKPYARNKGILAARGEWILPLEDWDLWLSIFKVSKPDLEIIHEPLLRHRIHGDNDYASVGSTEEEYSRNLLSKFLLFWRHSYLYSKEDLVRFEKIILQEMTPPFDKKVRLRARHLPDCASLKSLLTLLDSRK